MWVWSVVVKVIVPKAEEEKGEPSVHIKEFWEFSHKQGRTIGPSDIIVIILIILYYRNMIFITMINCTRAEQDDRTATPERNHKQGVGAFGFPLKREVCRAE